jgi:molybdate transport system regulatory protein
MRKKKGKKHSHGSKDGGARRGAAGDGFNLRGRVWVDGPLGTFVGYGRVVLMERIRQHGSITRAAKSMGMSYRRAWVLIDSMNRQARRPFVQTATGGRGGGGTRLTEDGERAVESFWRFYEEFQEFLRLRQKSIRFDEEER